MKALEDELLKENELIKNDRSFKELELEKLAQFWTITREQLENERHQAVELETRLQRVKAAHIEQISVSFKMLYTSHFIFLASTQTNQHVAIRHKIGTNSQYTDGSIWRGR